MKISDNNYCRIKLAMERYIEENNISRNEFTIGLFFLLHSNFAIVSKDIINYPFITRWKLNSFIVDNQFLFNGTNGDYYEHYPNNSNDSHLETVYKKLIKEIKF